MKPEDAKRLEEIKERIGNPGSGIHQMPATLMDMRFLLRVIEDQGKEVERFVQKVEQLREQIADFKDSQRGGNALDRIGKDPA